MEYVDAIIIIIVGLFLIIKGADWFVDSASWVAKMFGISDLVIGATVVAIGTTLPEFISSLAAVIMGLASGDASVLEGFQGLAVSNAVGSMLCNTALVLALVMLIKPPKTEGKSFNIKGIFLLAIVLIVGIFSTTGAEIVLWEGIVLLVLFVAFMTLNFIEVKAENKNALEEDVLKKAEQKRLAQQENKAKQIFMLLGGMVAIAGGAYLLVNKSEWLCNQIGVPPQIAGITIVALGTSLPELVTAITSVKKGKSDIGVGNIIGANIINATLIVGTIAVVSGSSMPIDWITRTVLIWVLLGIVGILVIPSIFLKKTTRTQGGIMMALYLAALGYNIAYIVQNL